LIGSDNPLPPKDPWGEYPSDESQAIGLRLPEEEQQAVSRLLPCGAAYRASSIRSPLEQPSWRPSQDPGTVLRRHAVRGQVG